MPPKHLHVGHRARMRRRFSMAPNTLNDHEILEILLYYTIPQKDTNELAHELLHRFGSLFGVLTASPEELRTVPGIGETASQFFPVIRMFFRNCVRGLETSHCARNGRTYDPERVGDAFISEFMGCRTERVCLIGLDPAYEVCGFADIGNGSALQGEVDVFLVLEFLRRTSPASVVVAHNHPSGVCVPSPEDYKATEYVAYLLHSNNVPLLDHIIYDGKGDYVSLFLSGEYYCMQPEFLISMQKDDSKTYGEPVGRKIVSKHQTNKDPS